VVTERDRGLFPLPGEMTLRCDCPDWAVMCKHVAAVLYGVGARLDEKPELLFLLRGVDHEELIGAEAGRVAVGKTDGATAGEAGDGGGGTGSGRRLASADLAEVFGIELAPEPPSPPTARASSPAAAPAPSRSPRPRAPAALTGASVARLRSRLKMSQSQFARLLGVSAPSVGNWERTRGRLHLQARTRDALRAAGRLTLEEARQRLGGASGDTPGASAGR
jgi:hypothetical protein